MTSPNHIYGGYRLYLAIAQYTPLSRGETEGCVGVCLFAVAGGILGGFPDLADPVLHYGEQIYNRITGRTRVKFPRWWFYGECHYGRINTYMRWTLAWGLHTEIVDPPVHVGIKSWLPQFRLRWKDRTFWRWPKPIAWALSRNAFTLWDLVYVLVEGFWWWMYTLLPG